jgi:small subunit ribosomal protein S11
VNSKAYEKHYPIYVGQRTSVDAICIVGLQQAIVMQKGAGSGRDTALRAIAKSGVLLNCMRNVNGK